MADGLCLQGDCVGRVINENTGKTMPYKPTANDDDYPERIDPRTPWEEWGPQHQEEVLKGMLGDELYDAINQLDSTHRRLPGG